ncbi:alpha/beta fold hydrolase [Thetidibacter halocola]|nr:alpha/beta fold hydrolase [Thetidibacter halocola]
MRSGSLVAVEPQVFDLIRLLLENAGRVVTRDEIVEHVWKGRVVSESAISARIAAARKALGDDGKTQAVIRTVARRGLQCVVPVLKTTTPGDRQAEQDNGAAKRSTEDPPRVRYTRNGAGQILAWTMCGTGTPILRIGAPLVNVSDQWMLPSERTLMEILSASHRLIHLDGVGFGLSEATDEPIDHVRMVDDCIAVADAAGIDRFSLMAESGASLIAVRLAALYPERVDKLVMVGGYVDGRARRGQPSPPDPIRGLIEEGWKTSGGGLALAFMLSYFPEGPIEDIQQVVLAEQSAASEAQMLSLRDAVNHDSVAEFLPRVKCPTLIVQGRDNAVHPLSEARKLAAGIPDAELVILKTANHVPMPGNAVWPGYIDALLAFLDDAEPGA